MTLSDVAALLHISINGNFFDIPYVDRDIAVGFLHDLFPYIDRVQEVSASKGPYVRLKTLSETQMLVHKLMDQTYEFLGCVTKILVQKLNFQTWTKLILSSSCTQPQVFGKLRFQNM